MPEYTHTAWAVYDGSHLLGPVRLVSVRCRLTPKFAHLEHRLLAWSCRSRVPRDRVHLTPEAAVHDWRDRLQSKIAAAEAVVARCRTLLQLELTPEEAPTDA